MDINQQKEQIAISYVRAIASVAGCSCVIPEVDDSSIDIVFRFTSSPCSGIAAQLKTTSQKQYIHNGAIHYPLPIKNYNDLRAKSIEKRILICMIVPSDIPNDWVKQDADFLQINKCAYWTCLENMEEVANSTSVTVTIPLTNMFTDDTLIDLENEMKRKYGL